MRINNILKIIASISITLTTGALASYFTMDAITTWYVTLNKPSFNPPNWIFGPVWTTLYILLGIGLFLIWKERPSRMRNEALTIFGIQLTLNFAWSFFFFYIHQIGIALIEIVLLWSSILLMIRYFNKINPIAAYINIPYLLWVTFATVLNAAYYILNQ